MKVLNLPLEAKWYEMIESGEKKEQYREIKQYWCKRLLLYQDTIVDAIHLRKDYTHIRFRYGYTKRTMLFKLKGITIGVGNPSWGAPSYPVFILKLGERKEDEK